MVELRLYLRSEQNISALPPPPPPPPVRRNAAFLRKEGSFVTLNRKSAADVPACTAAMLTDVHLSSLFVIQ